MNDPNKFKDINALAAYLREDLENKKFILLYAYNGTGKTRLSTAFKEHGKVASGDGEFKQGDTLYFNAFTEDLFAWDNDLKNDAHRTLKLNVASRFLVGLNELEIENRIGPLLHRYADFDFKINFTFDERTGGITNAEVIFSRQILSDTENDVQTDAANGIKISRGEENIFIWCFFLAIVRLALDDDGNGPYGWVKYIYIDDPVSSLDEHNAIAVANHLAQFIKRPENRLKTVISTHHTLFFNVLCNELKRANKYFLSRDESPEGLLLRKTGDTPFFHHVAALAELYEIAWNGKLYTHHFSMLRAILEKTASFHGYEHFSACVKRDVDDEDGVFHTRLINILSHGNYSLFEPQEMLEENKQHFRKILRDFIDRYPFNSALFPSEQAATTNNVI